MSDLGWSDPRVDLLRKLWEDGLSASQIAKQLGGVTRNAVIGKVHRLGLSGRAAPSRPAQTVFRAPRPPRVATAPSKPKRSSSPPAVARPAPAPIVDEGPGCATLRTLGAHMCKWPIGDPLEPGFTFCGRQAADGPYCPGHAQVAYKPGAPPPLHARPDW